MIEQELAEQVSSISFQAIQEEMLHVLKRNILDSCAGICCSLRDAEMLEKFDRMAAMTPHEKSMAVWGIEGKAGEAQAVFMNCILGRRSDLVNTYFSPDNMGINHPSDNVSLVLNMADSLGKTGRDVLTSTYVAYLMSCAFSDYYHPDANGYDHDAQALFYLPLVIGSMMGLSIEHLTQSQRIAGMLGLDTNQSCMGVITDWRHCTYASCAMRALQAVRMALAGFEGPAEIYEGEAGINRFLPHGDRLLDPPPDLTSVVFKRWPALVFCQTPIDVALDAADKVNDLGSIDNVKVYTCKKAIETAGTESSFRPVSRAGRTHSIPYCVAVALVKKTVEYEYFDDGFIGKEEEVAGLIPRITVVEDAAMTKAYPDKASCRIMVKMKDGTIIDESHDYPHGDPRDPLSDREIEEKAVKYLSSLIDHKAASTMIERVWKLESEASIDWLVAALKPRVA